MNEQEFMASNDPVAMLDRHDEAYQLGYARYPNDRKLRLFACACCRLSWNRLTDERSRRGVEAVERFADGGNFGAVVQAADDLVQRLAVSACVFSRTTEVQEIVRRMWELGTLPAVQAALLRDIVGNPWKQTCREIPGVAGRRPMVVYPGGRIASLKATELLRVRPLIIYRQWLTPTVVALAQAAYDERPGRVCEKCEGLGQYKRYIGDGDYDEPKCPDCHGTGKIEDGTLDNDRLAILSDALEEAGCDCERLLLHLRGWVPTAPGADLRTPCLHVRGCWAIDLILGKE